MKNVGDVVTCDRDEVSMRSVKCGLSHGTAFNIISKDLNMI